MFGRRDELLAEAHRRIASNPGKYIDHIYGEHEAGGTSWLYISSVPFDQLGFPMNVGVRPYPEYTAAALDSVPLIIVFGGTILAGLCLMLRGKRGRKIEACGSGSRTGGNSPGQPKNPGSKMLLFTLVILAAVASGAYSLSHKLAADTSNLSKHVEVIPATEALAVPLNIQSIGSEHREIPQSSESYEQQKAGKNRLPAVSSDESEDPTQESLRQQLGSITPDNGQNAGRAHLRYDNAANTWPPETRRE
jgi:hypothetical protein